MVDLSCVGRVEGSFTVSRYRCGLEFRRAVLEQRGVDLEQTPLFLTLGCSADKEINLFNAARLPLITAPVPQDPDAPLHVYATPDALYVSCGELSLLGRQAVMFNQARLDNDQRTQKPLAQDQLARQRQSGESNEVEVERISADPLEANGGAPAVAAARPKSGTRTEADSDQGLSLVEHQVALLMADDDHLEETFIEHEQPLLDPITVDLAEVAAQGHR